MLADDILSKNEMELEVAMRSIWEAIDSGKRVRLQHFFRDREANKMDVIFGEDGAPSCESADWFDFQCRYVKV